MTEEERKQKQKELFEGFKDWLLTSEHHLLKKVKYMILQGLDVSPEMIDEMRKA